MKVHEESLGNYVKIIAPEYDENYGKIGFVGGTIQKTVPCFSIYSFEGEQIVCFGDYAESELSILEERISVEDLTSRINSGHLSSTMIEEMQILLNAAYKNKS